MHKGRFIGTKTCEAYGFEPTVGSGDYGTAIMVQHKYIKGDEPNADPQG